MLWFGNLCGVGGLELGRRVRGCDDVEDKREGAAGVVTELV